MDNRMKKFWIIVGILLLCAAAGWGDDYVWTGFTDDNWAESTNWTTTNPSALTSADTLTINSGSAGGIGANPTV
ncbi:MAG: hypothetical protein LBC62_05595, partial [Treponema sp.]|nr:hypothetical protein [Treponema sp.]